MLKFYCYLLYKVRRFRQLIHIKRLGQRGEITVDAAGLMLVPMVGWSVLFLSVALFGLSNLGLAETKAAQEYWKYVIVVVVGLQWAGVWWGNYRLLKSPKWRLYAMAFSAYPSTKRWLGSIFAFFTLATFAIIPLVLLDFFDFFH